MRELRPNLCNPFCKNELEELVDKEGIRLKSQYEV